MFQELLVREEQRLKALVYAHVVVYREHCVECGICSYNCPIGIDIRSHVHDGLPISDRYCLACGQCVERCPRGALRFENSPIFDFGRASSR